MKKILVVAMVVVTMAVAGFAIAGGKSALTLKAGDQLYACNCGEACKCDSLSYNAGKCSCGKDMVKAKVTKVDAGSATLKADGWAKERSFKTAAKYTCACGPDCKCDMISQNPGKCTCGKDMKEVKAEVKK